MGLRNRRKETLGRLGAKTLEAQFLHEIQHGLNCSPFEAHAVLDVVKDVYLPFAKPDLARTPPGKVTLVAVAADEPGGKPVPAWLSWLLVVVACYLLRCLLIWLVIKMH